MTRFPVHNKFDFQKHLTVHTLSAITCSKLAIETLEQCVKYV